MHLERTSPTDSRIKALVLLRTIRTVDIGRMAAELLPAAMAGLAGEHTLGALRMMGQVLTEREATRKVVTR